MLIVVDVSSPILSEKQITNKNASNKEMNELNYLSFIKEKVNHILPKINGNQYNYYTLLSQSASLMIQQISAMTIEMYKPDVLIKIPMNSYGPFHFYKSDEIIKSGEIAAKKAISKYLMN